MKCLLFTSIISTSLVTTSCSSSEKYTFAMGYKTTYASQNDFTSNFIQVDAVSMILDSRGIVKDIMLKEKKYVGIRVSGEGLIHNRRSTYRLPLDINGSLRNFGKI